MPGADGELSIVTVLHGRRFWLLIPIEVGGDIFNMVLDTGSPFSAISETMRRTLEANGNVESVAGTPPTLRLRNVHIQGHDLGDLEVRLSRRASQVGADGILGLLDFLGRYREVCFYRDTMRLTLRGGPAA